MNGTTTSPQDAVRIDSELVRLLYRQTPTVLATLFVVAAITTWGLWGWVDDGVLLLWCAVLFVYTALRGIVLRVLWRRADGRDEALLPFARIYASTLPGNSSNVVGAGNVNAFPGFAGSVRVASGDVNGDGIDDIICAQGPEAGSGSQVVRCQRHRARSATARAAGPSTAICTSWKGG